MMNLFDALKVQYDKRESCVLAVVVETSGSTPREAGSYMLVTEAGRVWGTVGGGVTEYEAQCQAQEQLKLKQNKLCNYNLMPAEDKMCGGAQKILLHYVDLENEDKRKQIGELLNIADSGQCFWLKIPYVSGQALESVVVQDKFDDKQDGVVKNNDNEAGIIKAALQQTKGNFTNLTIDTCQYYLELFNYDGKVYILGGGHVAQALVPLLSQLDFHCIVVDDRDEFADIKLFKGALKAFRVDYEHLEQYLELQANDYVCIMTRAHTYDAECERFSLKTEVGYIGVMGSRFKAKLTREKLLQEGFAEKDIARVVTPIGISLPCETPMEIAVSIAAQLIQVRAERYK